MNRIFNFGAGPAMLPLPVLEKAQEEFLDWKGLGMSVIEVSHRSAEFEALLTETDNLLRELAGLPENFDILYVHGSAQMQFAAIPLNLMPLKPAHKAAFIESGHWTVLARKEAARYGKAVTVASSEASNFNHIPDYDVSTLDADTSYVHITSNNTLFGTRWNEFPDTGDIPLVADMTSELLSRVIDYQFGLVFAGLQKNLGPSGMAAVIIRKDLIGHAMPQTPNLLNYDTYAKNHSMPNTINTFAVYMMNLVLHWLKDQGGVPAMEKINAHKASIIYDAIDNSTDFYRGAAQKAHRSQMNITFTLANSELDKKFLDEAQGHGLYALKGHRVVGGMRASIYNAMPVAGCQTLADFMADFARRNG
jgi:phosphoserine aminotransferase